LKIRNEYTKIEIKMALGHGLRREETEAVRVEGRERGRPEKMRLEVLESDTEEAGLCKMRKLRTTVAEPE